jgi:hypothetical protein
MGAGRRRFAHWHNCGYQILMHKIEFLFALLLTNAIVGCGDHKRFVSESPDRRARVVATVPWGVGTAFRVVLIQDGKEHELYRQRGYETFDWLEVYWDPRGQRVGVFTCSDPNLKIAVDRRTLKSIPFSVVEDAIRKQLEHRFGHEVITWKTGRAVRAMPVAPQRA